MLPMTSDELVTPPHEVATEDPAILAVQRAHATRVVASAARDADDCAMLLSALGLCPDEGLTQPPAPRTGD